MKKGFTLVEMLVAMTITLWILAATLGQFFLQRRQLNMQEVQVVLDRNTRLSLMSIGQEIREIGFDPHRTHAFGITAGDLLSLSYLTDRDGDGVVDPADNGNIQVVGTDLLLNGSNILSDVSHLHFTYYDKAGNIINVLPVNEQVSPGFFADTVAVIQVVLETQIVNNQGKTLGLSKQSAQFERKNQ